MLADGVYCSGLSGAEALDRPEVTVTSPALSMWASRNHSTGVFPGAAHDHRRYRSRPAVAVSGLAAVTAGPVKVAVTVDAVACRAAPVRSRPGWSPSCTSSGSVALPAGLMSDAVHCSAGGPSREDPDSPGAAPTMARISRETSGVPSPLV